VAGRGRQLEAEAKLREIAREMGFEGSVTLR
jgi:hypothetical protein